MIEFSASQIASLLGGRLLGNAQSKVRNVAGLETAQQGDLCFLCDAKYLPYLTTTKASAVLITESLLNKDSFILEGEAELGSAFILVPNARAAMAQLLALVEKTLNPRRSGIEQPSFISEGVSVPEDAYIGAFAYIGKNVRLGKGVQIYPNTYIGDNVQIGDNTIIYAGTKVYYNCVIGNDCILHAGVVIGADGFGFEPDEQGVYHKVPQIGNVVIEDDVEIGANTCIDRAMMGETRIHKNTKLDNLVQIGHNVEIGESSVLCAQAGVAGSSKVGNHCTLTGQVGVAGHIEICDGCIVGAQSGVAGSIRKPGMYMGSPAIDAGIWRRAVVRFKQSGQH